MSTTYTAASSRICGDETDDEDLVAETFLAAFRAAHAYVTGEITMYTRMYTKERKINLVAGTHYATETFGVRALAQLVEARFGIA